MEYLSQALDVLVIFLTIVPLLFIARGARATSRFALFTNLSFACGLAALALLELRFDSLETNWTWRFSLSAAVRGLLSVGGMLLALGAIRARTSTSEHVAWPMLAGAANIVHFVVAFNLLLASLTSEPGTEWTYFDEHKRFTLTLPSTAWRRTPTTDKNQFLTFKNSSQRFSVAVIIVRTPMPAAEVEKLKERIRFNSDPQWTLIGEESGRNPHGCEYWNQSGLTRLQKKGPWAPDRGSTFEVDSLTYNPETKVLVHLCVLARTRLKAPADNDEMKRLQHYARKICLSVKC